jgi:hypothetical protein
MDPTQLNNISTLSGFSWFPVSSEYYAWMVQNPDLVIRNIEVVNEGHEIAKKYKPKILKITHVTKQTCSLYNLLEINNGEDISDKITALLKGGADVGLRMRHNAQVDKDSDEYEDFTDPSFDIAHGAFYPIPYACRHHCHPNIIKVLYEYTKLHPNAKELLEDATKDITQEFSQLYRSPFFIKRANNPDTYHYSLKKRVDGFLEALELDISIFADCDRFRYKTAFLTEHGYAFLDRSI